MIEYTYKNKSMESMILKETAEGLSNIISSFEYTPVVMQFTTGVFNPGYEYMDHSYSDALELIYILDGASYIGVSGQYMKAKKGECIVIFPGVTHNIYLNKKESCRIMDFIFKPGETDIYSDNSNLGCSMRFFHELKEKKMNCFRFLDSIAFKNLLESIQLLLKSNDEYSRTLLKLDFCKMYLIFSKIMEEAGNACEKSKDTHVMQAQQFIFENYCYKLKLEDISKATGISTRHLSRLFCKEFGMNLQDYITIVRISKARELLENSDMNITEIAYSLGFSSSDYFASFFKRYENISPKAYRKKVLQSK